MWPLATLSCIRKGIKLMQTDTFTRLNLLSNNKYNRNNINASLHKSSSRLNSNWQTQVCTVIADCILSGVGKFKKLLQTFGRNCMSTLNGTGGLKP